ncbi:MAG: 6-phosphogluconolactonase [Deltaproteobacteria bacterium]|nr:6-phosphogluconolactonase [Deltaproteobacteria bacterium]
MTTLHPQFHTAPTPQEAGYLAKGLLEAWAGEAMAQRGRFSMALAGGAAAKNLYQVLSRGTALDWARVDFFFGDERAAGPDHAESTHKMVQDILGPKLAKSNYHRMQGELPPEQAAEAYHNLLADHIRKQGSIDTAFMGMGGDGHCATLLPGMPSLDETSRLCVPTAKPDGTPRLTCTAPFFHQARKVVFITNGAEKAAVLEAMMTGPYNPKLYPAQLFLRNPNPQPGHEVHLILDAAAAGKFA